ncbi:MAG: DsbA family oxidoreductase [Nocardioides sp.]|nr:DsbA family oxidoreductase [Nocardioides sp.]
MRIEIWSDVVCPWCYIGKRRLETALAGFEHRDDVELVWRSFQLDPSAPTSPVETVAEHLGSKYGGGQAAGQQMVDRVEAVAAEEGLLFRLGQAQRVGTMDAHRLLHAAGERRGALKEALLEAYFVDARNVADHAVLTEIATSVGLDAERVAAVLAGDVHADEVEADIRQAAAYGATGVPFFVVDEKFAISGAQPAEVFAQALDQAWAAGHPQLSVLAGGDAEACGPDGCAI